MLKNHFLTTLRHLSKHKSFTFINLLGLTLGIGCSLFILLWVQDEIQTDRFHTQGDRLYRILINSRYGGKEAQTHYT